MSVTGDINSSFSLATAYCMMASPGCCILAVQSAKGSVDGNATLKAADQAGESKLVLPTRSCNSTAAPPRRRTETRTCCWAVHPSVTANASIRSINSVAKSSALPKNLGIESTKELSILTGPTPPPNPAAMLQLSSYDPVLPIKIQRALSEKMLYYRSILPVVSCS